MSFEKSLANMQTIFTGFSDNGEILNDSQNICLLFQKVYNPILAQIKASLQVSYSMDQSNTVIYDFISNILAAEASSLGDHTPLRFVDFNTCDEKAPENGFKRADGAIFTRFYSNWFNLLDGYKQSIIDDRERLNINGGGKHKSFDKKKYSRATSIKFKKKAAQKIQREISYLKSNCGELE